LYLLLDYNNEIRPRLAKVSKFVHLSVLPCIHFYRCITRIFVNSRNNFTDVTRISNSASDDELRCALFERLVSVSFQEISADPCEFVAGTKGLSTIVSTVMPRILNLSAVYLLTGDASFAARAIKEMLYLASFPD
jgi:hypothetical protein